MYTKEVPLTSKLSSAHFFSIITIDGPIFDPSPKNAFFGKIDVKSFSPSEIEMVFSCSSEVTKALLQLALLLTVKI